MPVFLEGSLHYYIHASLQSFIIYQPANKAASAITYILPYNHLSYVPAWNDKNHHIFRNPWTPAFRCYAMDTSVKNSNLRKMRLHSFDRFWTISTENQWETTEIGRLSCFSEFFVRFHILCDRYTSDYAHFTFSDTIWPLFLSPNFGTQMKPLAETPT